jgi:hypothetical protein
MAYMKHYESKKDGSAYIGDQAFIWDTMNREIDFVNDEFAGIKSYKLHCLHSLPPESRIVCFHGKPRPNEVQHDWMVQHWK